MNLKVGFIFMIMASLGSLFGACGRVDHRAPTFTNVYETVIAGNCATIGCHNSFVQTRGFAFNSKAGAYAILRGKACNDSLVIEGEAHHNYVVPGDPARSSLIPILRGDDSVFRMPPDRGISSVDIGLIEDWILEGAKCD